MERAWRTVRAYLRGKGRLALALLLFAAIFALVSWLYRLPLTAVGYASLLSLSLGAVLLAVDFARFCRRHRELRARLESIALGPYELPEARSALEEDYQALLRRLFDEGQTALLRVQASLRARAEYDTLWAHQIKTPIAAMRLLLQSGEADETRLSAELFRIEQYVEMLLTCLRLESESTDYVLRRVDVDSVLRACLRKYARLFVLSRLELDYRLTELQVLSDEKWLLFVVEQLIDNALKYTRRGRISLYTEGSCLIVQDSGIGILPEDLPRVFDRGFTGFNGRAEGRSTGLGLYLCRRIVDRLGHTLRLESEPGKGTRAILELQTVDIVHE